MSLAGAFWSVPGVWILGHTPLWVSVAALATIKQNAIEASVLAKVGDAAAWLDVAYPVEAKPTTETLTCHP
jgi:hypothetical protein